MKATSYLEWLVQSWEQGKTTADEVVRGLRTTLGEEREIEAAEAGQRSTADAPHTYGCSFIFYGDDRLDALENRIIAALETEGLDFDPMTVTVERTQTGERDMSTKVERDFTIVGGLPGIKERNAAKRELVADGWNVETGGYKGNYSVEAWKGQKPNVIRQTFQLFAGGETEVTPLYRRPDGTLEFMDGTPEYEDDDDD